MTKKLMLLEATNRDGLPQVAVFPYEKKEEVYNFLLQNNGKQAVFLVNIKGDAMN